MKHNTSIDTVKRSSLAILCVLFIVSCKKDHTSVGIVTFDYHNTASTQYIAAGKTNFAHRVLGNKGGIPLIMISALGNSMMTGTRQSRMAWRSNTRLSFLILKVLVRPTAQLLLLSRIWPME